MIDSNQFVQRIVKGEKVEVMYDPFGNPNQYIFKNDNSTTCVPIGNDNFEKIDVFLKESDFEADFKISWVKIVKDKEGNILHYLTDKGPFTDKTENKITESIRNGIASKTLEVKEVDDPLVITSIEVSVFLSRKYALSQHGPKKLDAYKFNGKQLGLPFDIDVEIKQKIEDDYFEETPFLQDFIKNADNNLIRLFITTRNIKKIFNWSKKYLEYEDELLQKSLAEDYALFKRKKSHGPRTAWYFDWLNIQQYMWVPILHVTNRIIGIINKSAHRKSIGLINKDDVGDISVLKVFFDDGQSHLWPLSTLKDEQINIFPQDFFWEHKPIEIAFRKIRFLINQGLYFEALVVAQAILESIINGMFPPEITTAVFGVRELRWEQKYKFLGIYFRDILWEGSSLKDLLNGGLTKIYKYRNDFSHDYLAHQPDYDFDILVFQQVKNLLAPLIDLSENQRFMSGVSLMYGKRNEFLSWLIKNKSNHHKIDKKQ